MAETWGYKSIAIIANVVNMHDNLIPIGINAPNEHQAVITRLIHGLADLYIKDKTTFFLSGNNN
jgi:hypothetical protein